MSDKATESLPGDPAAADLEAQDRREFLLSLGKWSKVVIGGALLGGALLPEQDAQAWDGGPGGGGAGLWYNSGNGWGGWIQQPWGWYDGPRWRSQPYWRNRPYWNNGGWYDRPWYNRPWYNGGWHNGWYNR